ALLDRGLGAEHGGPVGGAPAVRGAERRVDPGCRVLRACRAGIPLVLPVQGSESHRTRTAEENLGGKPSSSAITSTRVTPRPTGGPRVRLRRRPSPSDR